MTNMEVTLTIAGAIVVILGIVFVLSKHAISTGHSLIFLIGACLIALPKVANLEWSKDGVKMSTVKQASSKLAASVQDLTKIQEDLNGEILALRLQLAKQEERLDKISLAGVRSNPDTQEKSAEEQSSDWSWMDEIKRNNNTQAIIDRNNAFNESLRDTMLNVKEIQSDLEAIK